MSEKILADLLKSDTSLSSLESSSSSSSGSEELFRRQIELMYEYSKFMIEMGEAEEKEQEVTSSWRRGGSKRGRIDKRKARDHKLGKFSLNRDYFGDNPRFTSIPFSRRFHMSEGVYQRIYDQILSLNTYFIQGENVAKTMGLSLHQKITCALCMLCYGTNVDAQEEYLRIGEYTSILWLKEFSKTIITQFKAQYLRYPNEDDTLHLLEVNGSRGFLRMLGSLDCMHWKWKNCPTGWAGQYTGYKKISTVILEVVASQDFWIWHAFFGVPGSNNSMSVLHQGWLFNNLSNGVAPPYNYNIGMVPHTMGYYLTDGVYPKWQTLVQTIRNLSNDVERLFSKMQEACRKDVEHAFSGITS